MRATVHRQPAPPREGRRAAKRPKRAGTARERQLPGPPPAGESDVCEIQYIDETRIKKAERAMRSSEDVAALAETFRVLGDPNRVRIAWALAQEELCVCDLAALVGMSQSAVSHSLRALRQLRLVTYRKQGKIAYYRLDDDHVAALLADGFRHLEERR